MYQSVLIARTKCKFQTREDTIFNTTLIFILQINIANLKFVFKLKENINENS